MNTDYRTENESDTDSEFEADSKDKYAHSFNKYYCQLDKCKIKTHVHCKDCMNTEDYLEDDAPVAIIYKNGYKACGHDGTYCVCDRPNEYGSCPVGHDGSRCEHCNQLNIRGSCIKRHDGSRCTFCNVLKEYGRCPENHTEGCCTTCNTQFEDFECPRGHDFLGTKCYKCDSILEHQRCPNYDCDFERGNCSQCDFCDRLERVEDNNDSKVCAAGHTGEKCKTCNMLTVGSKCKSRECNKLNVDCKNFLPRNVGSLINLKAMTVSHTILEIPESANS